MSAADTHRTIDLLRRNKLLQRKGAEFLARLGRNPEAYAEFERAATLIGNARKRDLLLGLARVCAAEAAPECG